MSVDVNVLVTKLNTEQMRVCDIIVKACEHGLDHDNGPCYCDAYHPLLVYIRGTGGTGKNVYILD